MEINQVITILTYFISLFVEYQLQSMREKLVLMS